MAVKNRMHRSMLAVPGSNMSMVEKAPTLGADVVFIDLEDSVAPPDKEQARLNAIRALKTQDWSQCSVCVRVNSLDAHYCYRDVVDVVEQAGEFIDTILLPKTENPTHVHFLAHLLSQIEMRRNIPPIGIDVLIETASGMSYVEDIARSCPERLESMSFGVADYSASVRMRIAHIGGPIPEYTVLSDADATGERTRALADPWHFAWSRMIVACRANGLRPIDGPFGNFKDPDGYLAVANAFAALGGEGKWAIHPNQIELANQVFTPTEKEVTHARAIIAALEQAKNEGRGAVSLNGRMIDAASIRQAQMVIEKMDNIASRTVTA